MIFFYTAVKQESSNHNPCKIHTSTSFLGGMKYSECGIPKSLVANIAKKALPVIMIAIFEDCRRITK